MGKAKKHKTKKYLRQRMKELANREAKEQKIHPTSEPTVEVADEVDSPAKRAFREMYKED